MAHEASPPPVVPAAPAGTPLYVHVPFCAAKCHYCDFYSFAAESTDADGFVPRLLAEAEARFMLEPRLDAQA